jgi:hypothetical protein
VGLLAYLPGLCLAITYFRDNPTGAYDQNDGGALAGLFSLLFGLMATLIVLVTAIVLISIPRTRAFGAGMAIALAAGIIGGAGICVTMISAA